MDLSRLFFIARSFIFYYFTGLFSLVFTLFYAIIITVYNFEIIVNQVKVTMGKYYEKKTLIEQLQKRAVELGRVPAPEDMIDPPAKAYLGFFKKWEKAVKASGISASALTPTSVKEKAPAVPEISESAEAVANDPEPAEEAASQGRRRYSKSIITQMLLDEFKRLGKKPTRKEIDANKNLPTVSTCLNYFGTTRIGDVWDEILKDL